jgi:hypothetical protein
MFLSLLLGPFEISWIPPKFFQVLLAFCGAEPKDLSSVLNVHFSGSGFDLCAAK